ncbi:AAA family ATPase [Candidatus Peregrinibacteria bacterium]|nr:AAA family ATPase [Candidatus Peregrinibacteria bacterium]
MATPDDLLTKGEQPRESITPPTDESPETTDNLGEKLAALKYPGAKLCATLGIERDLEKKSLPKGSEVLEISVPTQNPQETYLQLKQVIESHNGFLLNLVFATQENLKLRCVVPNRTEMHNLTTSLPKGAKAVHRPDIKQVATYKGFLIQTAGIAQNDTTSVTEQSLRHAQSIKGAQPEITQGITVIKARLPVSTAAKTIHEVTSFIDAIGKPKKPVFEIVKNPDCCELTILVDGERSYGNTGRRLSKLLDLITSRRAEVYLDAAQCNLVQLEEGTFAVQMDKLFMLPDAGDTGAFETQNFNKARQNERDRAVARWETIKTGKACDRIVRITPVDFEAVAEGPRKMIGRDKEFAAVKEKIAKLHAQKRSNIVVLKGDRGIGKTRFIRETTKATRDERISSVYYKVSEEGNTVTGAAIKKLIERMIQEIPELRDEFRDLEFYATGNIPEGLVSEYGLNVQQLHDENLLKRRFTKFIQSASQVKPLVVQLDDLQWTDDFSVEIFAQLISSVEGDSNIILVLASREDEKMPVVLKRAVEAKPEYLRSEIALEKLDADKYLREYIESYLEANLAGYPEGANAVRETFVEEMKRCQGHPLVINDVLALLIQKRDIAYENDQLTIRHDAATELLTSGDVGQLVESVTQARFNILSPEARRVADWLVVTRDMDKDLFIQLLKNAGEDEEVSKQAIKELEEKGIATLEHAGFSHDSMREERRKQLVGRETETAAMAAKAYEELLKLKEQYPEINNVRLFQLLHNALERPDVLAGDQRKTFSAAYLKIGQRALAECLDAHDNPQVIQIAKLIKERTEKFAERDIDSGTEEVKIAWARYLSNLFITTAEAYNRRGQLDDAETCLGKIDELSNRVPSAGLRTGEASLPYHIAQCDIAYNKLRFFAKAPDRKAQQMHVCNQRKGELLAVIETIHPQTPEARLAKIDFHRTEMRILVEDNAVKNIDAIRGIVRQALTELSQLEKYARTQQDESLMQKTRKKRFEIERAEGQVRFWAIQTSLKGVDEEAKTAQQLTPECPEYKELREIEETLSAIRKAYSRDHRLITQPQYVAYVDSTLATLRWLTGRPQLSRDTASEGVRFATRLGASEPAAMISKFMGDTTVYSVLAKNYQNPAEWSVAELTKALNDYKNGLKELDSKANMWRGLVLNRGRCAAMLALAQTAKEGQQPSEDLKTELRKAWDDTFKALSYYKKHNLRNFIDELKIAGLLLEACLKSNIPIAELNMPREITREDISRASQQSSSTHADAVPADQWFAHLRNRGAMALSVSRIALS